VLSHQPQPLTMQSEHIVWLPQVSVVVHSLLTQSQLVQLPLVGPLEEPVRHWALLAHHPQEPMAVHVPHAEAVRQGSVLHELAKYCQLEHEPLLGPLAEPVWQAPVLAQ